MIKDSILGLRCFLFGILSLIKEEKIENCSFVEDGLSKGIGSILYKKYQSNFDKCGFCNDNLDNIDEYYKKFIGIVNGNEERKYNCGSDEGLYLLIVLALNEIF